MEELQFSPDVAAALRVKVDQVRLSGSELGSFGEREPHLASECGVELASLEARSILSGGAPDRILAQATAAEGQKRPFAVYTQDLRQVERLEGLVSTAASRIAQKYMMIDAQPPAALGSISTVIGLVTGAVNLVRTLSGK